jgi:hypothetical protein
MSSSINAASELLINNWALIFSTVTVGGLMAGILLSFFLRHRFPIGTTSNPGTVVLVFVSTFWFAMLNFYIASADIAWDRIAVENEPNVVVKERREALLAERSRTALGSATLSLVGGAAVLLAALYVFRRGTKEIRETRRLEPQSIASFLKSRKLDDILSRATRNVHIVSLTDYVVRTSYAEATGKATSRDVTVSTYVYLPRTLNETALRDYVARFEKYQPAGDEILPQLKRFWGNFTADLPPQALVHGANPEKFDVKFYSETPKGWAIFADVDETVKKAEVIYFFPYLVASRNQDRGGIQLRPESELYHELLRWLRQVQSSTHTPRPEALAEWRQQIERYTRGPSGGETSDQPEESKWADGDRSISHGLGLLFGETERERRIRRRILQITRSCATLAHTQPIYLPIVSWWLDLAVRRNLKSLADFADRHEGKWTLSLKLDAAQIAGRLLAAQMKQLQSGSSYDSATKLRLWRSGNLAYFFEKTEQAIARGARVRRIFVVCEMRVDGAREYQRKSEIDTIVRILRSHLDLASRHPSSNTSDATAGSYEVRVFGWEELEKVGRLTGETPEPICLGDPVGLFRILDGERSQLLKFVSREPDLSEVEFGLVEESDRDVQRFEVMWKASQASPLSAQRIDEIEAQLTQWGEIRRNKAPKGRTKRLVPRSSESPDAEER